MPAAQKTAMEGHFFKLWWRNDFMLGMVVAALSLLPQANGLHVLFIGNSFTWVNDVPGMVKNMILSDGSGRTPSVRLVQAPHLEDAEKDGTYWINYRHWDFVVLQGAMVSTSHQFNYGQDTGIALAKLAKKSGASVLLYSEWGRRGIDETQYTENVYRVIADASDTEVVPVGRIWDTVRAANGGVDLWQPDGNHALPEGSFIAATAIYTWMSGEDRWTPTWNTPAPSADFAQRALQASRKLWRDRR